MLSLFTSVMSHVPCIKGQKSSGSWRNFGLLNHLPFTSEAEIPLVKSSATLNSVGQCDLFEGEVLDWI